MKDDVCDVSQEAEEDGSWSGCTMVSLDRLIKSKASVDVTGRVAGQGQYLLTAVTRPSDDVCCQASTAPQCARPSLHRVSLPISPSLPTKAQVTSRARPPYQQSPVRRLHGAPHKKAGADPQALLPLQASDIGDLVPAFQGVSLICFLTFLEGKYNMEYID